MPIVITKSMSKFLKANEGIKDFVMSPLAKRTRLSKGSRKPAKSRKQRAENSEQNVTLSILAKPTDGCINGKNRSRFPDPCQDRSILLAVVDADQNFLKLNYLTSEGELHPDEGSEKEHGNSNASCQYFVLLEKIERKYATDNRTEVYTYPSNGHLENFMYANLQDHTIVDKCLPDGVAGYWIRAFGEPSVFILTIALWKWTGTGGKSKRNINTCSDCLRRLSDVKVEFANVARTENKKKSVVSDEKKTLVDSAELLKESANSGIIKTLRTFRDNGMVKEFDFACKSFIRTSEEHKNKDSCVIVMLEQSLFYSQQGNPSQAKKVLQTAVELSGKAKYSIFLLNRAYLYLATVHVNDGTTGTAEECLSMVKKDTDLGLPCEDVGWYYILKGIIYMKFGEKIEGFAEKLWVEAKSMFLAALKELEKAESSRLLSVEAHFCLAKLYLVIYTTKANKQLGSANAMVFQDTDDLIAMAAEHLSFIHTLDQSEFSERLQIKYNILQAEYCIASYIREEHASSVEEGYWSADAVDKSKVSHFSDSNHDEEETIEPVKEANMMELPTSIDNDSKKDNFDDESANMTRKDSQSTLEYFGLVISSRKCSPVELQDDEISSSVDEGKLSVSAQKKPGSWSLSEQNDVQYGRKVMEDYLITARDCLHKTEDFLHNSLFSLEKKEYDRVLALLEKMEKSDPLQQKGGRFKGRNLSNPLWDSGYEADCSSLDSVQLGKVYEQTTYV